ncbi:hypothetical protein QVD17_34892 [Tagetes erecta]|uniref:Phospholipase-like protein n=1 Tax=Tagetes erecta TaxID=13708 RepID=A0AAD8K4U8_TARER|nr:hypothetical protein QVD17_34892 [Tagetes erecta]
MVSKLSPSSFNQLEIELIDVGKKLLHRSSSSSTADIHNVLTKMKQILSKVGQNPSESTKFALCPIIEALISKELVRHHDMDVNIIVACCFCEILRINAPDPPYNDEQLKDIFEMVVITFEKLSSASGGCYTEMADVLKLFSSYKLSVLMLDLDLGAHELIVRLFKQFLTVADFNSSAIVLKMEKVMTLIIEESDELKLELVDLLVTFLRNNNPIASPVCWQLGEKVLMNFGARFKPHFPAMGRDMSIALYDYSRSVASICKTASENDIMTLRRCQHEGKTTSFDNPTKFVTEWKGKRKRNRNPLKKQLIPPHTARVSSPDGVRVCVRGYKVKQSIAKTLRTIFKKHGDIAAKCMFKKDSVRSSILEVVCEVVKQIQANDIIEKIEEIECQVSVAEAAKVDVTWLRAHLETIHKKIGVLKKSNLLMETKTNTLLVKQAAHMDLKERSAELVAAQERVQRAEMLVDVLDLSCYDGNITRMTMIVLGCMSVSVLLHHVLLMF